MQDENVKLTDVGKRNKYQKNLDEKNKAIILIQRLLRGRADQNMMYEGKEKRLALIDELLTVAKIQPLPAEEIEQILITNHEEKVQNALLEALQGEIVSETLDILTKELLRIKQVLFFLIFFKF